MKERVTALILAAGSGSRMNLNITKQQIKISDESVLRRSVRAFQECPDVDSIIIVTRADEIDFARSEASEMSKVSMITVGGKTRALSAYRGFLAIGEGCDIVAIHDAARCLVTPDMISAVLNDAATYGAATASSLVTDTIKSVDSTAKIMGTIPRSSLRAVQTPQAFRTDIYKKAVESADLSDPSLTDDNMLVERIGYSVHCTDTGKYNIKITTPDDLLYVNYILNGEYDG